MLVKRFFNYFVTFWCQFPLIRLEGAFNDVLLLFTSRVLRGRCKGRDNVFPRDSFLFLHALRADARPRSAILKWMTSLIDIERNGRVLELVLNRPEKRNALNREMCDVIVAACESAQDDPALGAIYLRANGPVFCSGMDLVESSGPEAAELTAIHARLFTMGEWSSKPIVCAVNGPAVAGGLGLVANAHIVLATHGSSFGLTEIRVGMWPFTIYRAVEAALGKRRTLELTLSSKIFNTPEALSWGLIHEVLPSFELDDRGLAIATALADASTETIQRGLRFVAACSGLNAVDAMALALKSRAANFDSLDFEEGAKAFREKRPPRWPSHP